MSDPGFFAGLLSSGNPAGDVAAFLLAAGRRETLDHCLSVAAGARELAERFGLDVDRATLAAACHDLAAVVPHSFAIREAQSWGLVPDEIQRSAPVLLHGPIAAAVMEQRLGVVDWDVLAAVHYHTTGRAGAARLEWAVFVADKIDLDSRAPDRDFVPAVRDAAQTSLYEAAFVYLDWVVKHAPRLGWRPHPDLLAAHRELDSLR